MNAYKKFINHLNNILEVIGIAMMLTMVFVIFYQVLMRYVFGSSPKWSEEFAMLLVQWFVFLGIVIGIKEDFHIKITMFVNKLSPKTLFIVEVIDNVLMLVFSILLLYNGFLLAYYLRNNILPGTGFSVGIQYVTVGIAGTLMTLVILGQIAEQIINRKETK